MRETLTILACLLVALLTAALAAPWFVDWTAQRDFIDAQIEKTLGVKVATAGAIDLKLLPTPRLVLDGAETREAGGVSVRSGEIVLELAAMPLLRGEFRFIEASFKAPVIEARLGANGSIAWPELSTNLPDELRFERITLSNATLRLRGETDASLLELTGLDLEAEASSLSGPYRGAGSVRGNGERIGFRFSTGAIEADRLRLKFISDEGAGAPRADLDGALVFSRAADGYSVAYDGQAAFAARSGAGWRASGPLKLDAAGLRVDPLDLKIGGDDLGLGLTGSAALDFGPKAEARFKLNARQFDIDRLLALQNAHANELLGLPARWIADAGFAGRAPLPWSISLSTPAMTLGGETLTEIVADVRAARGHPVALRLEGNGPGRAKLAIDGRLETGPAAQFQGRVEAGARDLGRFSDWLAPALPGVAERLRALPFRGLEASGEMTLSGAGFSARDMFLKADRSSMKGAAAFTRAIGADRARLFADMNAEALDLDAMPDLTGPGAALADMDFALGLDARAVRVTRFGEGMIDAGRIRVKISREREALRLETLSLADIGGASVEASGLASGPAARLSGKLDAQRLSDLAALLHRIAPGAWSQALAARAVALSPARLTFTAQAARGDDGGWRVGIFDLEGAARGTKIEASIHPQSDGRAISGVLVLDSADAPQLIRQIGFEALPLSGAGRARVSAELRGDFGAGFEATMLADIAGARLSYSGRVGGTPLAPVASGLARMTAADAAPFLRLMTLGLPDVSARLPLEAGGRVEFAGGRLGVSGLAGSIAGSKISGEFSGGADAGAGGRFRMNGALAVERLSLPALATLVLGPPQTPRAGALWSETRFAQGIVDAPLADIQIKASELIFGAATVGRDARFTLSLAPGVLQLHDLAAKIGAATLDGRVALRRDGPTAALSGSLAVSGWKLEQRAFPAEIDARIDFSSTGQNQAALVAGLAGAGSARIKGLSIARFDPKAPGRVIAAADAEQIYVSENDFMGALRRELDQAAFAVPDRAYDATLANGVLRLAEAGGVSAAFDLRNGAVDLRASLTPFPLPKDWRGPAPPVVALWKGPLANPQREVEAGAFVNALSARAIARETARIEALEADIRERAFFSRRQRGLAFLRLREREIAAYEVEQARLAAEAERRRIDEERRLADEERRRVAEAERRRLDDERRGIDEERRRAAEAARLDREHVERERAERERIERERRAADQRRREAEAARPATPAAQTPLRMPVAPDARTDPSAAGRY